jgi:hypothetical protein
VATRENPKQPESGEPVEVHVVEHPSFAEIDFELRALVEQQTRSPGIPVFMNFFDRGGRSSGQIILLYRPAERLLKRLTLPGDGDDHRNSRLEVWRDFSVDEMREIIQLNFLEKTRPPNLQPETFLGVLEQFIERGDI